MVYRCSEDIKHKAQQQIYKCHEECKCKQNKRWKKLTSLHKHYITRINNDNTSTNIYDDDVKLLIDVFNLIKCKNWDNLEKNEDNYINNQMQHGHSFKDCEIFVNYSKKKYNYADGFCKHCHEEEVKIG